MASSARVKPSLATLLLLVAVILEAGPINRALARPSLPSSKPFASEVPDLLSNLDAKRPINSSGKRNEGGFYKSYGSDADGEKGYLKKSFDKGEHGYKSYDTFHKKLGDRYGFEEHEVFGKIKEDKHQDQAKRKSANADRTARTDDHVGAGTEDVESYADGEGSGTDYYGYSEGEGDDASGSSNYSGSVEADGYYASGESADGSAEGYSADGSGEYSDY